MEVDIGFINRMEVRSAAPSVKFNQTEINSQTLINRLDENIYRKILHSYEPTEGDGLMNEKQVFQLLERTFYPFKEVKKEAEIFERKKRISFVWIFFRLNISHFLKPFDKQKKTTNLFTPLFFGALSTINLAEVPAELYEKPVIFNQFPSQNKDFV